MSDKSIALCATVESLPEARTDPGSEVRWCMICGDAVWCSVNTLRLVEDNPKVRIVCNPCGVPMLQAEPDKRLEATPGDRRSRREVAWAWRELQRRHGKRDDL